MVEIQEEVTLELICFIKVVHLTTENKLFLKIHSMNQTCFCMISTKINLYCYLAAAR